MAFWNTKHDREKKSKAKEGRGGTPVTIPQKTIQQSPGVHGQFPAATAKVTEYKSHYYGGGTYGHYHSRPLVPTPTDTKDTSKLSIVLLKQSTLNAISAICQPVAGASEFQVHYRALVTRIKNETNELIVSIPTVFYNFKQKVAHASVDYHLDDIDKMAEEVKPISDEVIKKIFAEVPLLGQLKALYGDDAEVTYSEVNSGSIHRHPGRFGFSGTDYTKTPSNPGVIYREAEATNKVHTDSVIYLGQRTEIYTTETRILNIAPKDNGVEGTYCQIPTTTFLLNDVATAEETPVINPMIEFLGGIIGNEVKDASGDYYITNAMGAVTGYALVTEIINQFKEANIAEDISNVLASNITSSFVTYGGKYTGNVAKQSQGVYGTAGVVYGELFDYDDDCYDYGYDDTWKGYWQGGVFYPGKKSAQKTAEKQKIVVTTTSPSLDDKPSINDAPAAPAPKRTNPYPVGTKYWEEFNARGY